MDLSLSVSPEPVSGDWSPAAAAASPSSDGAAFGAMLGDAVAGAPMSAAVSVAVPGTARPLDAAALLAFMGAPVDMAPQEGTLVPGMLSDLAGLTGAVGDAITGEPVDAAADTGEDSLDEAGLAVVVATAPPDLSSALPWGIPVAVPGAIAADAPVADTTGASAAAPDGADIASHLRAVEVSASAGSALTSGSMIGTGATPDGTTPFSRLAQGHGAERAGAHQAGVADGEAIALPGVISPATDAQVPSAELSASDASLVTDAAHLPSGGDAPVTRRKSGAGADEPWGVPMTGASSAMRADALRSILGQAAPAEGGDAPVADLAAALTRRESGAPRAAMMLAQALRPLEAPTVGQNGTDRLESMLASRDLEATMDAELPSQLIDAIRLQARSGVQEAHIRLRPEVLGEVSIAISVAGGAVSATIEAESPAVRQWVERHEGLLRERLSDQGLQLAQLEVKADDRQRDGERQRREQRDASKPAVMNRAQREAAAQRFAAML
jgi:flagellar hook-length control protein FliK